MRRTATGSAAFAAANLPPPASSMPALPMLAVGPAIDRQAPPWFLAYQPVSVVVGQIGCRPMKSSPDRSGKPNRTLRHCTALPAPPFIRLSRAATSTACGFGPVECETDVTPVRAGQELRLGQPVQAGFGRDDPDERLVGVVVPIAGPQHALIDLIRYRHPAEHLNPTHGFHSGRAHRYRLPATLADLGLVPVAGRREHPHRPTPLGMQVGLARYRSGAAGTRAGIDEYRTGDQAANRPAVAVPGWPRSPCNPAR